MTAFRDSVRIRGSVATLLALALCLLAASAGQVEPATNATAPPAPGAALSLADARRLAFERNWDLLAAKSGIDAATAQLMAVKEFPNPTLALSTAKIGTYDNATFTGNGVWQRSYDTIAAVSQLVEIGGKRRDRQASARSGIAGAKARFLDANRVLDQGVTKAYAAALLAADNARILTESARYMRREAAVAEARLKAGDISVSDKNQIEINAAQYELQAQSAAAAAVQARIAVEILLGNPQPKGQWTPADTLATLIDRAPPAPAAKPGAARPDVLAAEADLRRSRSDLQLQKAVRIPDPTFSVLYEHNPQFPTAPPPADTVGVGVSFPLPLWNRNRGNIKAAQAAVDQFALALDKAKAQAVSDLANAEVAYREAAERFQRYRDHIRPQAAKVRETVAYAYEKGGASLVDLLEAERTDNDVRLAAAQAMSDTASATADLAAARNALTELELNLPKR